MKTPIKVSKVDTPVASTSKASVVPPSRSFKDNAPCNWEINLLENGEVSCRNGVTQETFVGSISDFNKALRG